MLLKIQNYSAIVCKVTNSRKILKRMLSGSIPPKFTPPVQALIITF